MSAATLFKQTTARIGRITAIRWKAPDSDRCIVLCADQDGRKSFSVIGEIASPTIGQLYEFEGQEEYNSQYRTEQMKLQSYRTILPSDTMGIERYLTDTAKWVGPAIARELTKAFGQGTLKVIKESPERIAASITGITLDRAKEMQRTLVENEASERAAVEVAQMLGAVLPSWVARRAIKKWGAKAVGIIRRNPFALTQLHGVGFASADAVWQAMKKPLDSPKRHAAAVLHTLAELHLKEGHTVIGEAELLAGTVSLIGSLHPEVLPWLDSTHQVVRVGPRRWALPPLHEAERAIAACFAHSGPEENPPAVALDGLAEDQVRAARMFERSPVMVLTGAPGTGKTYTVARLVNALHGREVLLCAPTGKAAKQLTNALAETSCGARARTIHSALGPDLDEETGEFSFSFNAENPLPHAAVVVDEVSMVDARLAQNLLQAIRPGSRLLLVGDRHQLPSVGPGSVLRDLIAAGIPACELTQIKRNAGRIVAACHAIKDGQAPEPSDKLDLAAGENWRHIEAHEPADILAIIESLYRTKIPATGIIGDIRWDVQCIAPLNERGSLSCKAINELIQGILNPQRERVDGLAFSIGDKVVRLKNGEVKGRMIDADEEDDEQGPAGPGPGQSPRSDNTVRVVNGDIGEITAIDKAGVEAEMQCPARKVKLNRRDHELRLAYCLTCHKMQGSEAQIVILPLHQQFASSPIWTREWIYTAMSRAKLALITIGQISTVSAAVARVGNSRRRTMLKELLVERSNNGQGAR